MIYIIGVGGGGSFLLSVLTKTVHPRNITVIDADILEEKNLERQTIYTREDIGKPKAEAIAKRVRCNHISRFIRKDDPLKMKKTDVMFICADNNPARKYGLTIVDAGKATAIVCGNEYDSAQSYIYKAEWAGLPDKDPRLFFPEILTDESNDVTEPDCTEQYESTPQLAIFNASSAILGAQLYYLWTEKKDVPDDLKTRMFKCNFNKFTQIGGYTPKEEEQ